MPTMKLKDESLSGITAKRAVFFSPMAGSAISSTVVMPAMVDRLNFSSRTPRMTTGGNRWHAHAL
jgi:hypothetical protein